MITIEHYFSGGTPEKFGAKLQHTDATEIRRGNADILLSAVNKLLARATEEGAYAAEIDPDTGCQVSGVRGGSGDGGFRLQYSGTGASRSKHKEGCAVDVFDPTESLDNWLTDEILKEFGLFREHPSATRGWCHLQTTPPGSWLTGSNKRTFYP